MSSSIDNLFGSVENIDSNVSKLFSASSGPVSVKQIKRKTRTVLPEGQKDVEITTVVQEAVQEKDVSDNDESEEIVDETEEPEKKKHKKTKKSDEDDQLEQRYFTKLLGDDNEDDKETDQDAGKSASSTEEKIEASEKKSQVSAKKATKVDLKEGELEKANRTVFVGNLTNEVVTSKSAYKSLKKLFSTNLDKKGEEESSDEKFEIESIRFRSISFDEALPRKVAFTQNKLHKSRDSVNAYIVYKDGNVVKKVCSKFNGCEFMKRHLRVDSVTHPAAHDNKRSIFVGNLDFEEDEESLWLHFKSCGEIEYVRIVRDSKTNVGKGFAYVQFKDFASVNKALLLNEKPMKSVKSDGKKRKLRVSRCKNIRKQTPDGVKSRSIDSKLHENQRTKIGRARKVLGKADKATIGQKITIEGQRATKNDSSTSSILKKKKNRSKTGRVTKRSQAFRKSQESSK